ncbi:hypothetical protein JCM8547_007985 [Rhodosporidiobolus lusitaniae]
MPAPTPPTALVARLAATPSKRVVFPLLPLAALPRRALHATPASRSHVGSAPIPLPPSVTFVPPPPSPSSDTLPARAVVRGPKGQLAVDVAPFVRLAVSSPSNVSQEGAAAPGGAAQIAVAVDDATLKHQRATWGLTRSLLANAVKGVSEGYSLTLRLVGVGYRAAVEPTLTTGASSSLDASPSQRLNLKLGFAHPVLIDLPSDVQATTPSTTSIVLHGIDKQRLGQVAARIRSWRVPEPYNGKGIFVGDEQIRRKEVKKK